MLKKLLASILLATFLFSSVFVPVAKAQSTWYDQTFQEWYSKVYDNDGSSESEIFGERYTAAQVQWVIYGLWAFIISEVAGPDNREIILCFMNQEFNECVTALEGLTAYQTPESSALAEARNKTPILKSVFADRDLSGISYVKQKLSNFHIIPEAEAQTGFGFGALGPVQKLWRASRNISYTLFVFVAIVMAFMIMFRVKISPQVVISVQTALPKIIIAIVLVTFSYAIAGFLVDLLYVVIGVLSFLFAQGGMAVSATAAYNFMVGDPSPGILIPGIFGYLFLYAGLFSAGLAASLFGVLFGVMGFLAAPFAIVLAILALFILLFLFIFISLKILWMLFKAVATIYMLVIFGPLQITLGSIGPGGGFSSWLKNIASNLAVFPIVGAMFYLAINFAGFGLVTGIQLSLSSAVDAAIVGDLVEEIATWIGSLTGLDVQPLLQPPLAGWSPPLIGLGGNGTPLIFVVVSLIILMLIPKVADIIKSLITGKPFAYGTAIGEAFGPGIAAGRMGGLYAAGSAFNILEGRARGKGEPTPAIVQVGRRLTGLRSEAPPQVSPDPRK